MKETIPVAWNSPAHDNSPRKIIGSDGVRRFTKFIRRQLFKLGIICSGGVSSKMHRPRSLIDQLHRKIESLRSWADEMPTMRRHVLFDTIRSMQIAADNVYMLDKFDKVNKEIYELKGDRQHEAFREYKELLKYLYANQRDYNSKVINIELNFFNSLTDIKSQYFKVKQDTVAALDREVYKFECITYDFDSEIRKMLHKFKYLDYFCEDQDEISEDSSREP